jgi:DNA-binding transcriptional ArsR family regulator
MSLRGTLGDFGIADIFQLIGHQAKSGVLHLKDREIEVRISFVDGNLVKAEQSSRDKADLLGNIMVRAKALQQAQLDEALLVQQRTLRRLGDILVETGAVDRATLKEFARLQTTETIYRLFGWRAGTYEFVAEAVDYDDASYEPIRSENILMEGFRMVDEWPAVRKIIPSTAHTFKVLKDLPPTGAVPSEDDDLLAGLDDALGGRGGEEDGPKARRIGDPERLVYRFVLPERPASEIVDLSRLGEFETMKALGTLVANGVIAVVAPAAANEPVRAEWLSALAAVSRVSLVRIGIGAATAALLALVVHGASTAPQSPLSDAAQVGPSQALKQAMAQSQMEKLHRALRVHRVERTTYPAQLNELVDLGLVDADDLTFPFSAPYVYATGDDAYRLLAPLE